MKVNLNEVQKIKDFVRCTSKIESDVIVKSGRYCVDGKSIMGLFSLNLANDLEVNVIDQGNDEYKLKRLLRDYNLAV